ncbi:hypothetical protein JXI42_03960 [bacterium]|nr:hypothetical protein [bacterium]
MITPDIIMVLEPVIEVLEKLSIPYYIGGSVASSVYGFPRTTLDVDLVAEIQDKHILTMKNKLQNDFYIDEDMIAKAIKNHSSFNLIHLKTSIKIDIFIPKQQPYQQNVIHRREKDTVVIENKEYKLYFATPEDIIINKLLWFELGERISERQWLDILGVMKVQGDLLDKDYLSTWAKRLGLIDLLSKAFSEAGVGS